MFKGRVLFGVLLFVLLVSGCVIEISQPTQGPVLPQFVTATLLIPSDQPISTPTSSVPMTSIPVTWANLNLSGRLVYIDGAAEDNNFIMRIDMLDLATGAITTVFKAPPDGFIYYVSVSPDYTQLIMSYSPPPQDNLYHQALYTMPLDGSAPPQLLFDPPTKDDQYVQVEWSPDGGYVYYTHANYQALQEPNNVYPLYEIFRMAYPGGAPELVAEKAYWPRLSRDSSRLAYIGVEPTSFHNKLYVADANGANPQEVMISGTWNPDIKDAPIFSPDGVTILLSAPAPAQSRQPGWFEATMGISVARADGSIPSEWWSVPVSGGALTRLTRIAALGLFACVSPDQKHIASDSSDGIFVMNPDGSELTLLIPNPQGIPSTVSWIP